MVVVLREMAPNCHASGIETLLRCGESILFSQPSTSTSPSPSSAAAAATVSFKATDNTIAQNDNLGSLLPVPPPSIRLSARNNSTPLHSLAMRPAYHFSLSTSSTAHATASVSSSSADSDHPSPPPDRLLPVATIIKALHAPSSSSTSSASTYAVPSVLLHDSATPPNSHLSCQQDTSRDPSSAFQTRLAPSHIAPTPVEPRESRPVRKQALSYILNGGSQDWQQFDPLFGAASPSPSAGPAAPAAIERPSLSPPLRKRSAEEACLDMYGVEDEDDEGTARKRPRRRHSVPCEFCGRVFGESAALRKHIRVVHEKRKDFLCADCGRAFAEKSNLKKHSQARHGVAAKPHPCPDCNKIFSFSDGLRRHINNCHLGLRPYACDVLGCGHSFKQRTHLQKHQQSVHGLALGAAA